MPPTPRHRPPGPDERQAALPLPAGRRKPPTPEQTAKIVTAKRPSPVGQLDKAEITLRLVLPRAALERLTARAIREQRKVEALVQEILEGAATERPAHPRAGD